LAKLSCEAEYGIDIFVIMIHPALYIEKSKERGRGVFTAKALDAYVVIEISPVIVMTSAERLLLDQTLLHDYIFEWGPDSKACCMALGYIAVYNHSYSSNCEYEMDYTAQTIKIKTVRDIKSGEELFINYNGDWNDQKKLWFDAK
jgi:SET domain-containing protein